MSLSREKCNKLYLEVLGDRDEKSMKQLCLTDLFFLLTVAFKRKDVDRPWLFDRCREVEANPFGYLDLWSRDHYKSTLVTYASNIQEILKDPETTIGIFSHTRPIAKAFLEQIKREFETNTFLQDLFSDILYKNPKTEASKWSLDSGIIVKRKTNPKEATVEAWGLVDGQPTGKHFKILNYDDVVTLASVNTPEQIAKTTAALELSYNLGSNHGGVRRFIGTRYHANDTYAEIMKRGTVKTRIYPATDNGKLEGNPVLLTREQIDEKRRDMGPYTFSCFPKDSPVLMADWTEKSIDKITVGEFVVGYSLEKGKKTKLTKTKVIARNVRKSKIIKATFESGRVVYCTPCHKWYTGRRGIDTGGTDTHLTYQKLGFDKHSIKSLASVYDPRVLEKKYDKEVSGWVAGIFDGEGSVSSHTIVLHQTSGKNKSVCDRIEKSLNELDFDFGISKPNRPEKNEPINAYYIRGGREEKIRFLNLCNPARGHKIIDALFKSGTRNFGKVNRDKLVSIEEIGEQDVYNIQTETGNYVCYGYAAKNCQILQNPVADNLMGFKEEWLKYYEKLNYNDHNKYILVDPASKKGKSNDYTVMIVLGLGPDNNFYVIKGFRDRLNLTERTKKLFELHREFKPKDVIYEEYGLQADVEHIEYVQEQENYRFNITRVGGTMSKENRIRRLVPIFEQKRMWLPKTMYFFDYEGRRVDFVEMFLENEYKPFPVCSHDDMLDCMSRIFDVDYKFPKPKPKVDKDAIYGGNQDSWLGN